MTVVSIKIDIYVKKLHVASEAKGLNTMQFKATSTLTPKAQQTRQAIIAAARNLVGNQGVDGVTVMAVCDVAKVGRTSFYNYFADTQELLSMLADDVGQQVQAEFETLHGGLERGLERLELCLSMLFSKASSERELGLLFTALAPRFPEFAHLLERQIRIELEAATTNREVDQPPEGLDSLVMFLVVTMLALMRKFAENQEFETDTAVYVQYLMRSLPRVDPDPN